MKLPINIKALVDAAVGFGEDVQESVSISLYIDETAPGDVIAHVRGAFAGASENARITIGYLGRNRIAVEAFDDAAVLVAGLDPSVGAVAQQLRADGVPVMVVTTLPVLVDAIARDAGRPIPFGDIVSPRDTEGAGELTGSSVDAEPYALDRRASAALDRRMGEWIVEACSAKRLAMSRAFPFVRRPLAVEAVNVTAVQNAGIGLVSFVPGADMPIMTLNQAKMLLQIAVAYGEPLDESRVKELVGIVGGAFACRAVARRVAGAVPALGWAVRGVIGYTATQAMGRAAIEYFESGGGAAGVAGIASHAGDAVLHAVAEATDSPEARRESADRMSEIARAWAGRTRTAVATAADTAMPIAAAIAKAGADSFVCGVKGMMRAR